MYLYSPLYTSEIERALRSDPVQHGFLGVFASDQLPHRIGSFPASLVVNTDPLHKPGTHWIAYYFDPERRLDYFDSEGIPPLPGTSNLARFAKRNASKISFCDKPVQGLHSAACGYYCISFLALRARGYNIKDIVSLYWGGRSGMFDHNVSEQVHKLFGVGKYNGGDGSGTRRQWGRSRTGQCCCSVAEFCSRGNC
jgi:hypothetical protein